MAGSTTSEKSSDGRPSTDSLGIGNIWTYDDGGGQVAGMTPLDPSQWAYDSGDVIEQVLSF
jgi:hypothetical protein